MNIWTYYRVVWLGKRYEWTRESADLVRSAFHRPSKRPGFRLERDAVALLIRYNRRRWLNNPETADY